MRRSSGLWHVSCLAQSTSRWARLHHHRASLLAARLLRPACLPPLQQAKHSVTTNHTSLLIHPLFALQAAEERALADKCGNPLCSKPAPPPAQHGGGLRATQQAVHDKAADAGAEDMFCSAACAAEVKRFAARLGSGALALERFSTMYEQLRRQDGRQPAAQQQQKQQEGGPGVTTSQAVDKQRGEVAAATGGQQAAALGAPPTGGACGGADSDAPGGICSSATLAPRLAVEQVEVKRIDSSAGQFGDFSRKPRARPAGSGQGGLPAPPKGVLKKQSQFAAGTAKVPIMLAEVKVGGPVAGRAWPTLLYGNAAGRGRAPAAAAAHLRCSLRCWARRCRQLWACRRLARVWAASAALPVKAHTRLATSPPLCSTLSRALQERDPSVVAAETAQRLPPDSPATSARGKGPAATAVEGYVPRSVHSRQKASGRQRQRRVRWSDEVEDNDGAEQPAAEAQLQRRQDPEQPAKQLSPAEAAGQEAAAAAALEGAAAGTAAPPAGPAPAQQGGAEQQVSGSGAPASTPVLVFEVEEPSSTLEAGKAGLEAQFGRLRVADAASLPAAAAAAGASATTTGSQANGSASSSGASSSIDIHRPGSSASGGGCAVPPEWREAPQFYAHSPVGSSNSLASWASPGANGNTLAAAASSPPAKASGSTCRLSTPPPGLPRPPSVSSSRQQRLRQQQQSAGSQEAGPAAQDQEQHAQQAQQVARADQPVLTKRQAEQLQRAFPPLAAALPPELQAVLASDSETDSEAADSEDWMRSDDDEDAELGARWVLPGAECCAAWRRVLCITKRVPPGQGAARGCSCLAGPSRLLFKSSTQGEHAAQARLLSQHALRLLLNNPPSTHTPHHHPTLHPPPTHPCAAARRRRTTTKCWAGPTTVSSCPSSAPCSLTWRSG